MKTKISSGKIDFGAPIIDAQVTDVPINFGGDSNSGNNGNSGSTGGNTNNSTSTSGNNTNPNIIYNNGTVTEEEEKAGNSIDMKKLALLIGIILGVLVIFAIVAVVLYRRFA